MTRRKLLIFAAASLFILSSLPPVLGDGMPFYTYTREEEEELEQYGSTFESRQLARIELLNGTHQRIDLFLSVFSLRPQGNLTIIVPFRELPEEVSMEEAQDSDFIEDGGYDEIKGLARKQDMKTSTDRFSGRLWDDLAAGGICACLSPVGYGSLYIARTYELTGGGRGKGWEGDYSSAGGDSENGGEYGRKEVEKVAKYEFEGATLSVFSVSANATLEDFMDEVDVQGVPEITRDVMEEYKGHYAAVIESETSPPINATDYAMLEELMPDTLESIVEGAMSSPTLSRDLMIHSISQYASDGFYEGVQIRKVNLRSIAEKYGKVDFWFQDPERWTNPNMWSFDTYGLLETGRIYYRTPLNLLQIISDLLHSIYGFSDAKGNILSITTKLDKGKLYFPLGTSKGWDNPIKRTVLIVDADDDKELDFNIAPHYSAFRRGKHSYVFEFIDANPTEDLEAGIGSSSIGERALAWSSSAIYDNTSWLTLVMAVIIYLALWFIALLFGKLIFKKECKEPFKVLSWRNLLMAAFTLILSAPIAFALFIWNPLTGHRTDVGRRWGLFYYNAFLITFGFGIVSLIVEVMV